MTNAKQDVANAPDSRTGMKKYDGMCYRLARRRDTVVYYCSTYYKADRLLDPSDPSDASDISGMSDNKFVSHRGKVAQDRAGPEPPGPSIYLLCINPTLPPAPARPGIRTGHASHTRPPGRFL